VPFFIDDGEAMAPPRSAIVTGLGETIDRVPTRKATVCLFVPPFGCPTGPVYRAFDALAGRDPRKDAQARRVRDLASSDAPLESRPLFNDLAEAAEAVAPELSGLRRRLAEAVGASVHVTGSGSCCFAIMPRDAAAEPAWLRAAEAQGCVAVPTALAADAG
jgi:4-diphosphocytidyl-2-C-methyl-D-erythritol kinase